MADKSDPKIPTAIKNHQPKATLEMKTPGGSALRQANAEKQVHKDYAQNLRNRAEKYAKIEKAKIASKENVREGARSNLSKEFNKERER